MITARTTRLVRVRDLQTMQRAIAAAVGSPPSGLSGTSFEARACAIIVPTSRAAEALRRTLENLQLAPGSAIVLPDLLTRVELYERLHQRLPDAPPALSAFEREVIFRRAALDAEASGTPAPFRLRPGLVVEMLAFYDELRRRDRAIEAFDRLMVGSLGPSAEIDRGAERQLRLTGFLTAAFMAFERRTADTGSVDEHGLRTLLVERDHPSPYRHIVVTVPDQAADIHGLWPADYSLLARMPGVERLDIVATENVLSAGFHQRIHDSLPGIEEERIDAAATLPVLSAPDPSQDDPVRWFVCRDREEELVDVARIVKQRPTTLSRTAVVFHRPLPYLYLARQVFGAARIPYQTLDALPLAAEPCAAALDLVFSFVLSEANRASTVEMLASPNWRFLDGTRVLLRSDVAALDDLLRDLKYVGGWEQLSSIAAEATDLAAGSRRRETRWTRASPALRAVVAAASALRPVMSAASASAQISTLLSFISAHETLPDPADAWHERYLRARGAVLGALESLRDAHLRHDDAPLSPPELAGTVRRWIEGQTFAPRTGTRGILLMDAPAAAFADVDEVRLVGVVESDWPERGRRSIFYPSSLLTELGWPGEVDRLSAARARFQDLLRLAKTRVSVSTFTLEDDAIVPVSPLLEELELSGLPVERRAPVDRVRVFLHEAIGTEPIVASVVPSREAEWLALRASRSPGADDRFHGAAGTRPPAVYAVSRLERYLECPFKYFAAHVLGLPEERRDETALTPQERGQFLHEVFEEFFAEWQTSGAGAITTANVADALSLFGRVAESRLATLSESDRALERTYLLGSAAASGLAERAFAFEIEQGGEVIERLLEHSLEGEFEFQSASGPRRVRLRAKADRIDLLTDGTLRVIDYKLGKAPKPSRALQLPVYGVCAEQQLEGRHGRSWTVRRAGYVAFKEKNAFVSLGGSSSLEEAVADGQARMLAAIDAIERGTFPPDPDEPFLCTRCGYSSVCRKDYVGDE